MSQISRPRWVPVWLVLAGLAVLGVVRCQKSEGPSESPTPDAAGAQSPTSSTQGEPSLANAPPPIDPATVATLRGRVVFEGKRPERAALSLTAECRAHGEAVFDESMVVNDDGSVRNVLVHVVAGLEGRKFSPPADAAILDQKGCVYLPHVLAVRVGQTIEIRNSDGILHNVKCVARRNEGFNRAMPGGQGKPLTARFRNRELSIALRCDVHPWMGAWVHVLDHPFFAVTGDGGAFEIRGLPPGRYKVEALHETWKTQTLEVELAASEEKTIDFRYRAP